MVLRDEKAAGESGILHKEKLPHLKSSCTPAIITSIESKRVRCVRHVEGT